jgi:hypothetical protein
MTINYKTWFSVKLTHEFFNHDLFTDGLFKPAADTVQFFFSGTTWLQRFIDDTLHVLIKTDENGLPSSPIPSDKFFRFYFFFNNPLFFNYTDIDSRLSKGYILYVSNFANNKINTTLNLSAPILLYSSYPSNKTFYPGDLVTDTAGIVYECIFQSTNNLLTNTNFWLKRTKKQYISSADILRTSTANYKNTFATGINSLNATVRGFQAVGNTLAEYDAFTVQQTFQNPVTNVQFNLSPLQPGRYKIVLSAINASDNSVINVEETIYYDPTIGFNNAAGVVEIFNCISATDDYALQKSGSNVIKETVYTIGFANRTAWWNYISKTTAVTSINTTVSGLTFNNSASNEQLFTSNFALPFLEKFDYTPFTAALGAGPAQIVPWPSSTVLKCEKDNVGAITKVFTEVYLNY